MRGVWFDDELERWSGIVRKMRDAGVRFEFSDDDLIHIPHYARES
jgi:hypothetical protein